MIFDISSSEFTILDVFKISRTSGQKPGICHGRAFTSLSCRLSGHSTLESFGHKYNASTKNCLFIGASTPFTHYYDTEEVIAVHLSFTKNAPEGIGLIPCQRNEIRERFVSLYTTWATKGAGYICKCKSILYDIFYLFSDDKSESPESRKIKPSVDYLYSSYMNEDFSIEGMISLSFLSPAYFRRIFRDIYSTTVAKFVNSLRIERAKTLISSRKYTIGEISRLSGFSDEKYFSRVFKNLTGMTPTEYSN